MLTVNASSTSLLIAESRTFNPCSHRQHLVTIHSRQDGISRQGAAALSRMHSILLQASLSIAASSMRFEQHLDSDSCKSLAAWTTVGKVVGDA